MELIGFQVMDFTGNEGGRVTGVRLHCIDSEIPAGRGAGKSVYSVFLSSDKCPKIPPLGAILNFVYNRFGKVDHFDIIEG